MGGSASSNVPSNPTCEVSVPKKCRQFPTRNHTDSEAPIMSVKCIVEGHPILQYKYMCPKSYQEKISILVVLPSGFDATTVDTFCPTLGEDGLDLSFSIPFPEFLGDAVMLTHKSHSWMDPRDYEQDKVAKLAGLIPAIAEGKSHLGQENFSSRINIKLLKKCDTIVGNVYVSTFPARTTRGINCPCVMANIELQVESQKVKKSSNVSVTVWGDRGTDVYDTTHSPKKYL